MQLSRASFSIKQKVKSVFLLVFLSRTCPCRVDSGRSDECYLRRSISVWHVLCCGLVWPNGPPAWRNICFPSRKCNICKQERRFSFAAIFHFVGCLLPSLRSFLLLLSFTRRNNESLLWLSSCLAVFSFTLFSCHVVSVLFSGNWEKAVIITSRPSWVITLWQEWQWWQVRAAGLRVSANKEGEKRKRNIASERRGDLKSS